MQGQGLWCYLRTRIIGYLVIEYSWRYSHMFSIHSSEWSKLVDKGPFFSATPTSFERLSSRNIMLQERRKRGNRISPKQLAMRVLRSPCLLQWVYGDSFNACLIYDLQRSAQDGLTVIMLFSSLVSIRLKHDAWHCHRSPIRRWLIEEDHVCGFLTDPDRPSVVRSSSEIGFDWGTFSGRPNVQSAYASAHSEEI